MQDEDKKIVEEIRKDNLLDEKEFNRDEFPMLRNLSTAFMYKFVARPQKEMLPEYVYVDNYYDNYKKKRNTELHVAISQWNIFWEAGQLRYDFFQEDLPKSLKWLKKFRNRNIYLLPYKPNNRYYTYEPLFHLLPLKTRKYFNLPLVKEGIWPFTCDFNFYTNALLPSNFDNKLSQAFAYHIWPLLISGSKIYAFSKNDPIKILAHNLDYWIPYAYKYIENQLANFGRVQFDDKKQVKQLERLRRETPDDIEVNRPFRGGIVWYGEDEAWNATKNIVEIADKNGKLRSIIDAIKSNRIEDDFSDQWSFAKEDFERKIYKKRSKFKVNFVELNNKIPVHSPSSETHENLLWEDFLSILDTKEKRIVVLLKSGVTNLGEIGKILGYANHSPISKSLAKIRLKAQKYFE